MARNIGLAVLPRVVGDGAGLDFAAQLDLEAPPLPNFKRCDDNFSPQAKARRHIDFERCDDNFSMEPRASSSGNAAPLSLEGVAESSSNAQSDKSPRGKRRARSDRGCCGKVCAFIWALLGNICSRWGIKEEDTAYFTHYFASFARAALLISHGALMHRISALDTPEEADWHVVFAPLWSGHAVALVFLVFAVVGSCPYICWKSKRKFPTQLHGQPKLLVELFPSIIYAFVAIPCVVLMMFGERAVCSYLASAGRGEAKGVGCLVVAMGSGAMCAVCRGAFCTRNTSVYGGFGAAAMISVAALTIFSPEAHLTKVLAILPWSFALAGMVVAHCARICRYGGQFGLYEALLRAGTVGVLLFMSCMVSVIARKVDGDAQAWSEASWAFGQLGSLLYVLAAIVVSLSVLEVRVGGDLETRFLNEVVGEACEEASWVGRGSGDGSHMLSDLELPIDFPGGRAQSPSPLQGTTPVSSNDGDGFFPSRRTMMAQEWLPERSSGATTPISACDKLV